MIHTGLQLASLLAALASHADPRLWFVTRGAAVATYLLLAVSVALGLVRSLARALAVRASWVLDELHAYTALLAAAFLALHLISLVLDPHVPFPVITLLLPFGEPYRAFASALGVFALYAFAAVLLSSWLRRRLTYRFWRGRSPCAPRGCWTSCTPTPHYWRRPFSRCISSRWCSIHTCRSP